MTTARYLLLFTLLGVSTTEVAAHPVDALVWRTEMLPDGALEQQTAKRTSTFLTARNGLSRTEVDFRANSLSGLTVGPVYSDISTTPVQESASVPNGESKPWSLGRIASTMALAAFVFLRRLS